MRSVSIRWPPTSLTLHFPGAYRRSPWAALRPRIRLSVSSICLPSVATISSSRGSEMYFSKYGAYSVESGLVIIVGSFQREIVLNRIFRLRNHDALFERRFHIRFERETLLEIGFGFSLPAHLQPEYPAVGVDLGVARVDRERLSVIGEGGA